MRSPNRKFSRKVVRRLLGLSVLLAWCALLFPLPIAPLAQTTLEKDQSEPFPCQNRPCGCRSAEECWKKCCCFTDTQKVAWAKVNKVKLPDFVFAAAKKESLSGCCHPQKPQAAPATQTCGSCSKCHEVSPVVQKEPEASKWVMAVFAAECQGQGQFSFCFPASIIPDRLTLVTPHMAEVEIDLPESERLQPTSLRPPLPPPKIV
jgi:hypothetical protein